MGIAFVPIEVRNEYLIGTFDESSGMTPEDLPKSMRIPVYGVVASARDVFKGSSWLVAGSAQLRLDGNLLYATPYFFADQANGQAFKLVAVSAASHEGASLVRQKLLGLKISSL